MDVQRRIESCKPENNFLRPLLCNRLGKARCTGTFGCATFDLNATLRKSSTSAKFEIKSPEVMRSPVRGKVREKEDCGVPLMFVWCLCVGVCVYVAVWPFSEPDGIIVDVHCVFVSGAFTSHPN